MSTQNFALARLLGEGGEIKGNLLCDSNLTSGWTLQSIRAQFPTGAVSALGATTLDRNAGEVLNVSLNGNSTFSVINWPPSGVWAKLVLLITNAGAFNVTAWPSGTIWPGGTAPTITSGSGKRDCIILMTGNAGATVWGSIAGQDYR
jgi:hypothetical protein